VSAVLLDIDGTLVDSNGAHAEAWAEALAEHGRRISVRALRQSIGKGGDKLLAELCGLDSETDVGKQISKRRGEIFLEKYLPRLTAFPKARELVEALKAAHFEIGVATSAKAEEAEALLNVAGVADLIQASTSSDDAENSKPDPDIVQAALQQLRAPAAGSFLLGDTPYDVEAGLRAGVSVVAVCSGGWTPPELAGATACYDDVADLLRGLQKSPFMRGH
jgi:HAD superfamily hydrolase (TIGR01509 family)